MAEKLVRAPDANRPAIGIQHGKTDNLRIIQWTDSKIRNEQHGPEKA
jgi:hypothetical protein